MEKTNTSYLQTFLTVLFVSALLISNVITTKQIQFVGGITMTGAVLIFPITYVLSDLFSEVYGYRWSRVTCYLAFAMNLLMVIMFTFAINTPAPSYWENQEAFVTVLGSTPRTLAASLAAFVVGDWANDNIFRKMKAKHENELKGFGARAILSSLVGEMCDSLIFIPAAFIGAMPIKTMIIMGITQIGLKVGYECIILPVTTIATRAVQNYEGNKSRP